jgi:L-alanine-DL-glutamate epimerase-like enolase superfamily enzyme
MKIRDLRIHVLETALTEPFAYSQAWYERRGAMLVEIIGEDGLSGWGEAFGPPRLTAAVAEYFRPLLPPGLFPIEPLLEFDQSEHPIRTAVLTQPIVQRDGWVEVPDGPGLGIEIDRAALRRFSV